MSISHAQGSTEQHITPGDRVAFLMKHKNWNFKQTSEAAKISASAISHLVHNKTSHIRHKTLVGLAKAFNCSVDWLLGQHPDQLRQAFLCTKAKCGMHAQWAIIRRGVHLEAAALSCNEDVAWHLGRESQTDVLPIHKWAQAVTK